MAVGMMVNPNNPWYRELTGYHWWVLLVATLGWLFDFLGLIAIFFAPETHARPLPE